MADTNIQDSPKKTEDNQELQNNQVQPGQDNAGSTIPEDNSEVDQLREQIERLKGQVSAKDKKKTTLEQDFNDLKQKVEKQALQLSLSQKLDQQENLPLAVRASLRSKIDSFNSEDQFNQTVELLTEATNATKEEINREISKDINTSPDKAKAADFQDKVASAGSMADLEKLLAS